MPSSQPHKATVMAGPGDPTPSSGRAQTLHGWDGLTPNLAFWAVDMCVLA